MPLTCASFWLTFAVCPKNFRAGALGTMRTRVIGSEHTLSSMSESEPANVTNKKVKKQRGSVVSTQHMENSIIKEKSIQSDVLKVQTIRDDPSRLEKMNVQELRATMRSFGIPARGCKSDLISSLKCFVADEKDVCSSQSSQSIEEHASFAMKPDHSESTLSKREAKNSSVEVKPENMNFISEELEFHTHKRQGKLRSIDSQDVESNSKICTKKQKCSKKIDEATAKKSSQAKRKASSRLDNDDDGATHGISLATNLSEPWTVLTHKKPQQGWVPYNPRTMRPPPLTSDKISMKIMSWNVNGIRALLKLEAFSALELAKREDFDVLCLQETKLQEKDVEAMKQSLIDGYGNSFWTCSISKLGYSGTAIISRIKPLSVKYGLGVPDHDSEGRLLTVEFDRFYLLSGYVPNSGDGLKRLNYRVMQWDPSLGCYIKELEKSKPVILTGDLNCAHQEIDIFNPAGNKRSAGFTDEERESFEVNFLSRGFVDTFRQKHPGVVGYTYWGYRHNCRKSNKGWRLDYFLVSESIAEKVHDSYILPDVNGSDHCPIGLILKH